MAHSCLSCEYPLVTEIAPQWGQHSSPYPAWLQEALHEAGLLADLPY